MNRKNKGIGKINYAKLYVSISIHTHMYTSFYKIKFNSRMAKRLK